MNKVHCSYRMNMELFKLQLSLFSSVEESKSLRIPGLC
jgi:hypothetical protein